MFNQIIEWSVHNRFLVAVLACLLIVLGLWVASQSDVDVLPDFAPPQITVRTEAPGLAPEEVESLVSIPIESVLNGVPGVKLVRSVSTTGVSNVLVILNYGTDMYISRQLVNEKLQIVTPRLPAGVGPPVMLPIMPVVGDVLKVAMMSNKTSLMDLRTLADWDIHNRLLAVPGVARVTVMGGDQREYQVLVHPDKLRSYGITLNDVRLAVTNANTAAPGGFVVTHEQQVPVRGISRIRNVTELANSVIVTRGATPVLLKHVATVQVAPAFRIGEAIVNGTRAVELIVSKQPNANTLDVSRDLEKAIAQLRAGLPPDIQFVYVFRLADFIEKSVGNVLFSVGLGGFIVVLVLLFFLMNWRTSLISLTAIPLSLLSAILAIKATGGSINTMTLGGLAIAVGEVVDDAIVDVENVYRRLRENKASDTPKPSWRVIVEACREVRSSVVYATFVVALVFVPVFLLQGLEGRIFGPLGFSYVVATLSSLVVALTVTPALCMYLLGRKKTIPDREPRVVAEVKKHYKPLVRFGLDHPGKIVVAAAAMFAASVVLVPFMGQDFLPKFQEGNLTVAITALPGQSLELTTDMAAGLEKKLIENKDVLALGHRIGRAELDEDAAGPNFSEMDVRLKETGSLEPLLKYIREQVALIPGVVFDVGSFISHRMDEVVSGGSRAEIAIKIFGPDVGKLQELANAVAQELRETHGTADVRTETQGYMREITVHINRDRAAQYGLTAGDVSSALETVFNGKIISQVLEKQKTFGLKLWFDEQSRGSPSLVNAVMLDTPSGGRIPLSEVAKVEQSEGPSAIIRENVSRRIAVLANASGRDVVSIVNDAKEKIAKDVQLPPGYYLVYAGEYEAQQQATSRLLITSLFAFAGILLLLRQGLGSWKATFLVASNLPLACIGGLIAVALTGNVLTVGSLVGFISLFGVSTRNSLMLVSRINTLSANGENMDEAISDGALERVTPVLMTALTAGLGMLPLAVMPGTGRELEQPLAVVIVGGMVTSTALTLLVIPALFKLFIKGPARKNAGEEAEEAI